MKFGKVDDPENIDFTLPPTPKQTTEILKKESASSFNNVMVGCAKWNRTDLKNFYPRGTKDELNYYSTQFNSIELNASFYRMYPEAQFEKWYEKTETDFKFFPKIPRLISQQKRLNDTERLVDDFVTNILALKEKLGMVFLQMPPNFHPKDMDRLNSFFEHWPDEIPLAAEFRHPDWYSDKKANSELNEILIKNNITHIITDSAGRRDLVHMQLTNPVAFIRYNGANHKTDYTRLDDWLDRLEEWHLAGLKDVYFFVHQNMELESPLLAAYFIEKFNNRFGTNLKIPKKP